MAEKLQYSMTSIAVVYKPIDNYTQKRHVTNVSFMLYSELGFSYGKCHVVNTQTNGQLHTKNRHVANMLVSYWGIHVVNWDWWDSQLRKTPCRITTGSTSILPRPMPPESLRSVPSGRPGGRQAGAPAGRGC